MIITEMKRYNTILIEKQQKYRHYHQGKTEKYEYFTDHSRVIEQTKFTYSFFGKIGNRKLWGKSWRKANKSNQ